MKITTRKNSICHDNIWKIYNMKTLKHNLKKYIYFLKKYLGFLRIIRNFTRFFFIFSKIMVAENCGFLEKFPGKPQGFFKYIYIELNIFLKNQKEILKLYFFKDYINLCNHET